MQSILSNQFIVSYISIQLSVKGVSSSYLVPIQTARVLASVRDYVGIDAYVKDGEGGVDQCGYGEGVLPLVDVTQGAGLSVGVAAACGSLGIPFVVALRVCGVRPDQWGVASFGAGPYAWGRVPFGSWRGEEEGEEWWEGWGVARGQGI